MPNISEYFDQIFRSEHVPSLTQNTISIIQSFLAYALDSEFQARSSKIISFFAEHLQTIRKSNEEQIDKNTEELYSTLISMLSYLRPPYISSDFFLFAEKTALHLLQNFSNLIQQASFSFLCTHYIQQRDHLTNEIYNLFNWIQSYFTNCKSSFQSINVQFFVIITSSIKHLIQKIIGPVDPNSQAKNPNIQQTINQKMQKLQGILTPLIELSHQGLIFYSKSFSLHDEILVNKSLRLITKFIDSTSLSQSNLNILLQMMSQIPDDSRFFHIKQNFIIVTSCIALRQCDFPHKAQFFEYARESSIDLISHFHLFPLSSKRKLTLFLQHLKFFFSKMSTKSISTYRAASDALWQLFVNSQIGSQSHVLLCHVFFKLIDRDLLLQNLDLSTSIIREVFNCFDYLRIEFETSDENFEFNNWLEVHVHLIKTVSEIILKAESSFQDGPSKEHMQNPIERLPLYQKMTKHFQFIMNVLIVTPEIRDKLSDLIYSFGNIIHLILLQSDAYLPENMIYLLPNSSEKSFYLNLHRYLLKHLKSKSPQKHLIYCQCFFDTILNNFDSLFQSSASNLLEIVETFVRSAFIDEDPSAAQQTNYRDQSLNALCFDLYKFFLRCFNLRNPVVFRLLLRIISLVSSKSIPKLAPFMKRFSESPFSIPNVISYLCEDPRVEPLASSLAIFLYSFCESSINSPPVHAEWYRLFIPAIESDQPGAYTIMPFYKATSSRIAELLPQFPKPLQCRLVTSLAFLLTKFRSHDDLNLVLSELCRIPLITTELSRSTHNEIASMNAKLVVNIDGIDIDVNGVKDTLKKLSPHQSLSTLESHCKLFEAIVYQIDFQDAVFSDAVDLLAERICHDNINFIRQLTETIIYELTNTEPPVQETKPSDSFINQSTEKDIAKLKSLYNWLDNLPTTQYSYAKHGLLKSLRILFYYRVKYMGNCGIRCFKSDPANQSQEENEKEDSAQSQSKKDKETDGVFEPEDEENMEIEIAQMFEDLGKDQIRLSFLESFLILVYTKQTAFTALKAIEIMLKNFDYFPIIKTVNSAVVWGAHFDYQTSKRILTNSLFKIVKKHAESETGIPDDVRKELNKAYFQSCLVAPESIVKVALRGLRFLESCKLLLNELYDYRKKVANQLGGLVSKNQRNCVNYIFFKPFDDLVGDELSSINSVNNMISSLEAIHQTNKTNFLKEAIRLVNSTGTFDKALMQFCNARFYVQAIAYFLASLPETPQSQNAWERIISLLRDYKCRHFYSFFLKQISKYHQKPSMPLDCQTLINPLITFSQTAASAGQSPSQPPNQNQFWPTVNDFELLRLMLIHSAHKFNQQTIEALLNAYLAIITRNPSLLTPLESSSQAEAIGLKIFEIIKTSPMDLTKIIPTAYEASVITCASKGVIKLPLNIICERFAKVVVYVFSNSQKRNWLNGSFCIFSELLKDDSLVELRSIVINQLKNDLTLNAARDLESKLNLPFVTNCFLTTAASITNSMQCTYEMFVDIIEIVKKFSPLLIEANETTIKFRPSIFIPMIEMCLPGVSTMLQKENEKIKNPTTPHQQMIFKQTMMYKSLSKNSTVVKEMNQNLRNTSIVNTVLLPFFLDNPKLFLQHLFIDRFCYFIKFMFTEFEERHSIYLCLESSIRNTDNIHSNLLAWLMLNGYMKHFPDDIPMILNQRQFSVDFESFPLSPMVPSYLLHSVASLISIKKSNDQLIQIPDFHKNRLITVDSTINAIGLYTNNIDLFSSCQTVTRFFNILKFFIRASLDFDSSIYFDRLFELLKNIPLFSKAALNTFQYFALNEIKIDDDERAALFATFYSYTNLYTPDDRPPDNSIFQPMKLVLKRFVNVDFFTRRAFELFINCSSKTNESLKYLFMLHGVFDKNISKIDLVDVYEKMPNLTDVVKQFKEILNKIQFKDLNQNLRLMTLFASLAKLLLFNDPTYCPPFWHPKIVFNLFLNNNKDYFLIIYEYYKQAMISCINVSGQKFKSFLINELYLLFNEQFGKHDKTIPHKPLKTAFATICMWLSGPPSDAKFLTFVSYYLNIFMPQEESEIITEILNMKQPFSHMVEDSFLKLIKTDFLKDFCMKYPTVKQLFFKNAEVTLNDFSGDHFQSLYKICWSTKWNESHIAMHLYNFAKFILPDSFTTLVKFIDSKTLIEVIITALNSISFSKEMEDFAQYYTSLYPTSSLTECFAAVFTLNKNTTPLPHQSPFAAMTYLENRSFYEDSLGILKTHFPVFLAAASYHQLNNYEAAKIQYLRTMDEHPDSYFYGLNFLRSCELNLSLAKTSIPLEMLAYIQSFTSGHEYTSFFSTSYLCRIFRFLLQETLNTANHLMQDKQTNPNQFVSKWTPIMMKTLDKEAASISNYAIRFSFFHSYQSLGEQATLPIVQEVNRLNRQTLSRLLMESGTPRIALKQYETSLNIHVPFIPQTPQSTPQISQQNSSNMMGYNMNTAQQTTAQIQPLMKEMSLKTFKINSANLPRIKYFMQKRNTNGSLLLQFRLRKALHDQSVMEAIIKCENHALQQQQQQQQQQQMKSMYSPQMTPQSAQLMVSGNNKFLIMANQMWTDVLASLVNEAFLIDESQIFIRIQNELGPKRIIEAGKIHRTNYLIALALSIARFEPRFRNAFISTMLVPHLPDDVKIQWLNWLQILFTYFQDKVPEPFLIELYKFQPVWFHLIIHTQSKAFLASMNDFLNKADATVKERKQKQEFEACFQWMKTYQADMVSYFYQYQMRTLYYQFVSQPTEANPLYEKTIPLFNNSIEEMAKFCDANPAVFTTKRPIPDSHVSGFKFPTVVQSVAAVSVTSDGNNEACVKFVSITGDIKKFSLVFRGIYRFRVQESLFMFGLQKILDKHLSSRTRSSFVFYPKNFRYYEFCFVSEYPLVGMQKITHDNHYDLALCEAYKNRPKQHEDVPKSYRQIKETNFPKDVFPKFYAKLAKGNLTDFLFARQSFASHLALNVVLRKIVNSPLLPLVPSLAIFGNGQRVVIPEFLSTKTPSFLLPITPAIKETLPDYIFQGSFTTTWLSAVDALHQNSDTIRVYLKALLQIEDERELEKPEDEKKYISKRIVHSLGNLDKLSTHSQEKTDSFEDHYSVLTVKHIIDNCNNVFYSHRSGFGWI